MAPCKMKTHFVLKRKKVPCEESHCAILTNRLLLLFRRLWKRKKKHPNLAHEAVRKCLSTRDEYIRTLRKDGLKKLHVL
jgi:hypothetical protein